jgi:hypothetical protein
MAVMYDKKGYDGAHGAFPGRRFIFDQALWREQSARWARTAGDFDGASAA